MDAETTTGSAGQELRTVLDKVVCVKWETPSSELLGMAMVAKAMVDEGKAIPEHLCFAVPNNNWAAQTRRACAEVGLDSSICIPQPHLGEAAGKALATLQALATVNPDESYAAWANLGYTRDVAARMYCDYANAHAFTLVRVLGLKDVPQFAHALQLLSGEEDAATLHALICEQLSNPSMSDQADVVPIVDFRRIRGSYEALFLVGSVDGLVPRGTAGDDVAAERECFKHILSGALAMSTFPGLPARLRNSRSRQV